MNPEELKLIAEAFWVIIVGPAFLIWAAMAFTPIIKEIHEDIKRRK